jgi:pyruvate kinase
MVARGDLGVELPIQEVTNAQKEMITACNVAGKPVIVATQMLESMTKNPRPTRAEVSDVSNAVHDGADALMTSGETAKGKYPIETVKMMNEIILKTERYINNHPNLAARERFLTNLSYRDDDSHSIETSIAKAAVAATSNKNLTAIVVVDLRETKLSILISAYRPRVPIIVFTSSAKIARQMVRFIIFR